MNELATCARCGGFVSQKAEPGQNGQNGQQGHGVCPHCEAPLRPRRGRRWGVVLGLTGTALGIAGAATIGLTLMACYGAPPCEGGGRGCRDSGDAGADAGADGADGAQP